MLFTNQNVDQALLSFLSRQSVSISQLKWEQTISTLIEGDPFQIWLKCLCEKVPQWSILENETQVSWQKRRDHLFRLQERGISFLLPQDFPAHSYIRLIEDPPRCLTGFGNIQKALMYDSLAVVGSREPSGDLLVWMDRELTQLLKDNPQIQIVSGGARGVDQQAHLTSIKNRSATCIWLPSGLLELYPSNINELLPHALSSGGAVLSEYHPNETMKKWYFHQRNRLICGMSQATWVVQCAFRSGTWMTAGLAAQLGRPVFVTPGYPWQPEFLGNLMLLREGATLMESYLDLQYELRAAKTRYSEPILKPLL